MNKMTKFLLIVSVVLVSLSLAGTWGFTKLKDYYIKQGLDMYHNQCYNVGGYVINDTGTVVMCKPLVQIPKQELDKMPKV